MDYAENLALFLVLLAGIIIVPGMDMLFVMTNAITGGRRLGIAATAGIASGGAVHTLFGAVGVGVLARWMPAVLPVVVYAGAAYMAWIGFTLIRSSISLGPVRPGALRPAVTVFAQGLLTCLLNPKAYLFVFSVYPQFLKSAYGPIWLQAVVLGIMTVTVQAVVYGSVATGAARLGGLMAGRPAFTIWAARFAGLIFVVVAALVAWPG
ncbi:LysE family translocator [Chthonobacter albigriseus]|uniref:LysE family translocator n=1 Tax=Chthonobacter albigriseus TaxID=1683161 RepID=UPI0015EFB689|nr:LysE family translocator [Chthonobacter albigriseus]